MIKILNIYKPIGLRPLQLINILRARHKEYQSIKIGFAGRLDPLAHGVMLLMLGDETKNRDKYLSLTKEYEFEVLFGMSTDTYDSLGLLNNLAIKQFNNSAFTRVDLEKQINQFIRTKLGRQHQPYPPYSSKEVNGKPLFQWAREKKLSVIEIPCRETEIYEFEQLSIASKSSDKIKRIIFENIEKVNGDFRQDTIIKQWQDFFYSNNSEQFTIAKFRVSCSSGTYVRSIANEIGQIIGVGAIALSILRTKVGENKLDDSLML
ncbi:MAG TPA: hypothetical protein VM077_02205 [Candidatus Limnocylindrales bacterium]|nr:hypothetical protein [Candidatus Limnocylindrales bacterium]